MFSILQPFIASMIRHAVGLMAGALAAHGVITQNQVEPLVGAIVTIGVIAWSAWHKLQDPAVLTRLVNRVEERHVAVKEKHVLEKIQEMTAGGGTFVLAILVAAALLIAPAAFAQQSKPPPKERMNAGLISVVKGALDRDGDGQIDTLFQRIRQASIKDLEYAKALADQAKDSPQAQARSRCYGAWLQLLATLSSADAAQAAAPAGVAQAFTKFEQMSQVADNLAPLSSFQQACAPVAMAMRRNISQFVLAVVGGGLSLGSLGVLP